MDYLFYLLAATEYGPFVLSPKLSEYGQFVLSSSCSMNMGYLSYLVLSCLILGFG